MEEYVFEIIKVKLYFLLWHDHFSFLKQIEVAEMTMIMLVYVSTELLIRKLYLFTPVYSYVILRQR